MYENTEYDLPTIKNKCLDHMDEAASSGSSHHSINKSLKDVLEDMGIELLKALGAGVCCEGEFRGKIGRR